MSRRFPASLRFGIVLYITLLAHPSTASVLLGRVVGVSDGDTITVLDSDKRQHKVRLTGIDAPEKSQPFGEASKKNLSRLVYLKDVRVESHKQDRYGRILGKVWVQPEDCLKCGLTLDANLAQLTVGRAWWYRKYASEQSPTDRGH
jgi:endonuclease YncB( thermonuclease family)